MSTNHDSDARNLLANTSIGPWTGTGWRLHRRLYPALDDGGSRQFSGRFHRAPDKFPEHLCWPALYFSLLAEISLGEIIRNTSPAGLPRLNEYRLSEVHIELEVVLDLRDIAEYGISPETLLAGLDYSLSQNIGAAALSRGAEGILVPSATRLGDNLVVFPENLRPESRLEVIASRDPVLYVERKT